MVNQSMLDQGLERKFKNKTIIYNEDDNTDHIYYIKSGCVKMVRHRLEDGKETIFELLGPGDWFGEMSYMSRKPRTESAITRVDSVVVRFNKEVSISDETLMEILVKRIDISLNKNELLMSGKVYTRLINFLNSMADEEGCIKDKLTHSDISGFIGSSREMISLIVKQLHIGKFVTSKRGYYKILKPLPKNY